MTVFAISPLLPPFEIPDIVPVAMYAARWKKPNPSNPSQQLGTAVLDFYNFRHDRVWVWIAFAVTIGWILLLNLLLLVAFSYLPRKPRFLSFRSLTQCM